MRNFIRITTWTPRTVWGKALMVVAMTIVITLVVTSLVFHEPEKKVAPGEPIQAEMVLSSKPHGISHRCSGPSIYNTQTCTLKFQRGNVEDMLNYIKGAEAYAVGAAVAIATGICAQAGAWAAVCGVFAGFQAAKFIQMLKDAKELNRCAQVKWTQLAYTIYGPLPMTPTLSYSTLVAKDQTYTFRLVKVRNGYWADRYHYVEPLYDYIKVWSWPVWCMGKASLEPGWV